jgi:hypothetical protein
MPPARHGDSLLSWKKIGHLESEVQGKRVCVLDSKKQELQLYLKSVGKA